MKNKTFKKKSASQRKTTENVVGISNTVSSLLLSTAAPYIFSSFFCTLCPILVFYVLTINVK